MEKKIKLSATRINTFLQCKQRYWFSYEEHREKLSNPSFKLGLACHETLEKAGRLWQSENLTKFSEEQIQELLDFYDKASVKNGVEDYSDHVLGKNLVKTRLNNFKLGEKIVGIEDRFGFENTLSITTDKGVELIGAIDKTIELDNSTIIIVDYKTSRTVPEPEKLRNDIQLSMYDYVASKLYPQYSRVILCLDMLRTSDMVYTYRTADERKEFEKYLFEVYTQMMSLTKEDAKPSINSLCAWCDHTNACEKYQELCSKKEYAFLNVNTLNDEALLEEWESVRAVQKILETREREIADVLINKLKIQENVVTAGDKELVLRQKSSTSYNAQKLSEYISYEDFANLVSISSSKLKKYLERNPSILPIIDEISETNFSSAFLATRKIKKEKNK